MAYAWEELSGAYGRGCADDGASLPEHERDLYYIQSWILEFEVGGWLYNWTPEWERFDRAITAMRRKGLTELANIIEEIKHILQPMDAIHQQLEKRDETITWDEMLELVDPDGRLNILEDRIGELDNYGLPEHW